MISISLCMIVKNEEEVLSRCLNSIADLMDEIIIVDTGSTDRTKEIASKYTDRIYDFTWTGNFSDARNFSFQKATKDYIYCADADELLDDENHQKFALLKKTLLTSIDIVQMYYDNQLSYNTIYNYDKELRPKLYKRVRHFVWENAIHEAVRLEPTIYDSDIVITHKPTGSHTSRDLNAFEVLCDKGIHLNQKLHNLYAKELYISGEPEDFLKAKKFFSESISSPDRTPDEILEACCICVKASLLAHNDLEFFQYTTKGIAAGGCSEICCELGSYYFDHNEIDEACLWFYNAAFETESVLSLKHHTTIPLNAIADCYEKKGLYEDAKEYRDMAKNAE